MAPPIRLQPQDEALLERAASHLRVCKSEFIRRSVAAYARQVIPGLCPTWVDRRDFDRYQTPLGRKLKRVWVKD